MKTSLLCATCAVLAAFLSGYAVHRTHTSNPNYDRDRKFNEALSKTFQFSDGFEFRLNDIRIETYSEKRPWTRIIGSASTPDVPMVLDLIDETGDSILATGPTDDRVPLSNASEYLFETYIALWTNSPELSLVVSIYPDEDREETIVQSIPNPIHFHQLLDLDLGEESMTHTLSVGTRAKLATK
ncbi:MAG: hypothetical protein HRU46_15990 [Verrucomicrobiales bacterium]|nr:hypothetical protein [Verrucomicrobiales bacterium]